MTAKAQRRRRKEVVANDDAGGDDVVAAYVAVCEAAGTDTAWLDCIDSVNDPWRDWLLAVQFPSSALDAWIETHIRDVFRAADARRLALDVTTKTKHFAAMWADFRREHVELDDRGKYRRNRYWIWRAATLKQAHERGGCFLHGRGFLFQDVIDANLCANKLAEAMAGAGAIGMYHLDGSYIRGGSDHNFWRPCWVENEDGTRHTMPIHDYAAMVLSLVRAVS